MLAIVIAACSSCSSSSSLGEIRGQVTVDGQPVELGTIQFRPTESPTAQAAGGAVNAGEFNLGSAHGLAPGKYSVLLQAMKSTGRTFKDPQRGEVPVRAPVELVDSPKEVDVTSENSEALKVEFAAK